MVVALGGGASGMPQSLTEPLTGNLCFFFVVPPNHFLLGGWPCEVFLFLSCDAFVGACACLGISCFVRERLDP